MPSLESELKSKLPKAGAKAEAALLCRVSNTYTGLHLYLRPQDVSRLADNLRVGAVSIDTEQMELMVHRGHTHLLIESSGWWRVRWSIDTKLPLFGLTNAGLRQQPNGSLIIQLPDVLEPLSGRSINRQHKPKPEPQIEATGGPAPSEAAIIAAIRLLNGCREAFGLRFSVTPEGALSVRIEKELA